VKEVIERVTESEELYSIDARDKSCQPWIMEFLDNIICCALVYEFSNFPYFFFSGRILYCREISFSFFSTVVPPSGQFRKNFTLPRACVFKIT